MMDTRRIVLWVIFTVSIICLWDSWQHYNGRASLFFGPGTVTVAPPPPVAASGVPAALPEAAPSASATPGTGNVSLPAAQTPPPASTKEIAVRTDLIAVDINTLGAQIDHLELLQDRDTVDPQKNMVLLSKTPEHTYVAQSGLIGAPDLPAHTSQFQFLPGPTTLEAGKNDLEVSFEAESGGVRLIKTYTFTRGSYEIGVRHRVENVSDHSITTQLYLQLVRDSSKPEGTMRFYSPYYGPAVYSDKDKFQKVSFDDIRKERDKAKSRQATDGWVAMLQHYFVAAWIPSEGTPRTYLTQEIKGTSTFRAAALMPLGSVAPGATVSNNATLFVGPEDERLLEHVAPGLDLVRDYGWTTILARPVFWLLERLHALLGNWGWAIIALTIIIKGAFFPLSAASYRSMARMKNVAPRLKIIQEKHKDDRAKMNQAMMELYRTEKINPMGGCLPIAIQIPVFIALYSVLSASVEMRGAPWLGWIHDLAAPDPFYILPAVMMVSMFVQYKLNPAPPDPVQAKMMMFMPLVFGVTFFFFPAGLVIYWVVNNILSIAQQWQISRMIQAGKK